MLSLDYVTVHRFQQINPKTDPELWYFDPYEGFIVQDVAVDMSGMYACEAVYMKNEGSNPTHEVIHYVVSVQRMLLNLLYIFFFYLCSSLVIGFLCFWLFGFFKA